jgi:hypothetical protein
MSDTSKGFYLKNDSEVSDFGKGASGLLSRIQTDLRSSSFKQWLAVTAAPSSQGLINLGQDIGSFSEAVDFASRYAQQCTSLMSDLSKFENALNVLAEAAGQIAKTYKNAHDSDTFSAKGVDDVLNNAQELPNSPFT